VAARRFGISDFEKPTDEKSAGRVPPDAILFCKRQKKYAKMAFSPAEGISCAVFYVTC
jgi:hypothetical protein